jgi:hypothetical protein
VTTHLVKHHLGCFYESALDGIKSLIYGGTDKKQNLGESGNSEEGKDSQSQISLGKF